RGTRPRPRRRRSARGRAGPAGAAVTRASSARNVRRVQRRALRQVSVKLVVKVQLSLATTEQERQMLITDAEGHVMFEGVASPDVVAKMGDEPKAFFHAIVTPAAAGKLRLGLAGRAPDQEW